MPETGTSIAVLVPAHNSAGTLPRLLESIERQTLHPDEVIIVNDGSTDGSAELLAAWEARGTLPLTIIHQANGGASAARNAGLKAARSDYIALVDADDEFLPRALEVLKGLFAGSPNAVAAFGDASLHEGSAVKYESYLRSRLTTRAVHYDDSGDPMHLLDAAGLTLRGAFTGAIALRRDALLAVDGFDESLVCVNDRDLFLRVAMAAPRHWVFTWEHLQIKHYLENSLSSRNNARRHAETELVVLDRFRKRHAPLSPGHQKIFSAALRQSTSSALSWAGRAGPRQVIRTLRNIRPLARGTPLYWWGAKNLALSIARKVRDSLIPPRPDQG